MYVSVYVSFKCVPPKPSAYPSWQISRSRNPRKSNQQQRQVVSCDGQQVDYSSHSCTLTAQTNHLQHYARRLFCHYSNYYAICYINCSCGSSVCLLYSSLKYAFLLILWGRSNDITRQGFIVSSIIGRFRQSYLCSGLKWQHWKSFMQHCNFLGDILVLPLKLWCCYYNPLLALSDSITFQLYRLHSHFAFPREN